MNGPTLEKIRDIVKDCIIEETGHKNKIEDTHDSSHVEGWDSIAHIRIMYRIDFKLGTEIEIRETYAASNIMELAQIFFKNLQLMEE